MIEKSVRVIDRLQALEFDYVDHKALKRYYRGLVRVGIQINRAINKLHSIEASMNPLKAWDKWWSKWDRKWNGYNWGFFYDYQAPEDNKDFDALIHSLEAALDLVKIAKEDLKNRCFDEANQPLVDSEPAEAAAYEIMKERFFVPYHEDAFNEYHSEEDFEKVIDFKEDTLGWEEEDTFDWDD